jgi:hypothetical protein
MSSFEDRLWSYLVLEHRHLLTGRREPAETAWPRRQPSTRHLLLTAGGVAVAGAIAAVIVVLAGATSPAAFAISRNSYGEVTITLKETIGVTGLNRRLDELGVPIKAYLMDPNCSAALAHVDWNVYPHIVTHNGPPPAGVTIQPAAIPAGHTLVIAARPIQAGPDRRTFIVSASMLVRDPPPPCVGEIVRPAATRPIGPVSRITPPSN